MKTTIELSDDLLARCRVVARRDGATIKALVEEGLQRVLHAREARAAASTLTIVPFRGDGLTAEFQGAGWDRIRDEIYVDRG